MFDKFLFKSFTLHYSSADPSTATGQYIVAFDRDYADNTPTADDAGIRAYFAMAGSKISSVWESTSFKVPISSGQDFYYCNDSGYDGRLVFQGQIYLAAVSGTTFHGSLWIEYEIDFYDPQIDQSAMSLTETQYPGTPFTWNIGDSFLKFFNSDASLLKSGVRVITTGGVSTDDPVDNWAYSAGKNLIIPPGRWLIQQIGAVNADFGSMVQYFMNSAYRYNKAVKDAGHPIDYDGDNIFNSILESISIDTGAQNGETSIKSFVLNIAVSLGPILFSARLYETDSGSPQDATAFGWVFSILNIGAQLAAGEFMVPKKELLGLDKSERLALLKERTLESRDRLSALRKKIREFESVDAHEAKTTTLTSKLSPSRDREAPLVLKEIKHKA